MENNNSKNKKFTAGKLLSNFIFTEVIILYVVIVIGDLSETGMKLGTGNPINNSWLTRYIPTAIASALIAFVIILSCRKKCGKSEYKEVKRNILIAPVIVGVIVLLYGLYSVSVNINEFKDKELGFLKYFVEDDELEKIIEEGANQARLNWLITSIGCLISAEIISFIMSKNIENYLIDDSTLIEEEADINTTTYEVKNEELGTQNNNEENSNKANDTIKWNL